MPVFVATCSDSAAGSMRTAFPGGGEGVLLGMDADGEAAGPCGVQGSMWVPGVGGSGDGGNSIGRERSLIDCWLRTNCWPCPNSGLCGVRWGGIRAAGGMASSSQLSARDEACLRRVAEHDSCDGYVRNAKRDRKCESHHSCHIS